MSPSILLRNQKLRLSPSWQMRRIRWARRHSDCPRTTRIFRRPTPRLLSSSPRSSRRFANWRSATVWSTLFDLETASRRWKTILSISVGRLESAKSGMLVLWLRFLNVWIRNKVEGTVVFRNLFKPNIAIIEGLKCVLELMSRIRIPTWKTFWVAI